MTLRSNYHSRRSRFKSGLLRCDSV